MVRETLIPNKILYDELEGNPQGRDTLLTETYGIEISELRSIRQGTLFERAQKAAVWLRDHDFSDQVNYSILIAMCAEGWDLTNQKSSSILGRSISKRYSPEASRIKEDLDLDVPLIQIFREQIGGIYEGQTLFLDDDSQDASA